MISNFKTSKFLLDKAQAFADAQGYRLSIQGAPFEPITTEIYLQESFLANDNDQLGIGFDTCIEQSPIYQIDVLTPKGQGGKFVGQSIADLLLIEFKRGPIIFDDGSQTVQITSSSHRIMPANKTHNWTMVQVDLTVLATSD